MKKTSAKKNHLTRNSQKILVFILQLGAIILSVTAGYFIWVHAIVDKERQHLNQLSLKNAQHQQQIIQNYLGSLMEKVTLYSQKEDLSYSLLSDNQSTLSDYQNKLIQDITGLKSVRFFGLHKAQIDETEIPVNFVVMDMINRGERGEDVYPEMIRYKKKNIWLIAIVAPIYQKQKLEQQKTSPSVAGKISRGNIIGTMYLAVSVEAVQSLLSSLDQTLGQTQLAQQITDKKFVPFITLGDTGNYLTQRLPIANSNWQLSYTPSTALYLHARQPRTPIMLAIAVITLLLMILFWFAARLINQRLEAEATDKPINKVPDSTIKKADKKYILSTNSTDHADNLLDLELSEEDQALFDGGTDRENIAITDQHRKRNLPDSIFRAYDIRGIVDKQLTCELAETIGQAFASEVLDKGDKIIFIGRDGRTHSPKIADAFTRGVLSTGCNVIDLGLVPTPLMNFATSTSEKTSSGAMVTASHNPKEYNGFKFVIRGRTLIDQDIQAIKNSVAGGNFHLGQGIKKSQDISQHYIERIFSDVALVEGPHVVIDAANGSTSTIAPMLFEELGCTVTSLFCEIDGNFPNHDPDPTVVKNLLPLISKVKQVRADMGFAFDGDGDRLVVVTPKGKVIWPDQLMMLFAEDVASRNPGCDIIYDVKSTRQLSQVISQCGGRPIMWKTGHANMKTKMRDTGALLAGEFSGHIFFKERWFGFDDGMYAAARLLEIITLGGRDVDDIFEQFQLLITTPEIKIPVGEEEKFTIIESLLKNATFANGKKSNIDGIRVDFSRGWGLIRASNTSPALTLRFEAETEDDMEKIKRLFRCELNRVNTKLSKHF